MCSSLRSKPVGVEIWTLTEKIVLAEQDRVAFDEALDDPLNFQPPPRPFTMVGSGDLVALEGQGLTVRPQMTEEEERLEAEMRQVLSAL